MRSVKSLLAAGAASLISSMAFAADMPIAAPPPMYAPVAPPSDFGGWYLRGDIGFSNQRVKKLDTPDYRAPGISNVTNTSLGFDAAGIFGLGAGYKFNNWFRADVTGEYRGRSNFHGLDIVYDNTGAAAFTDDYHGSKSEWLVLANAYVDLGTWWCVTPFIGAGVGGARIATSSFYDMNINVPGGGVSTATDAAKWNFAWALHAGLAYKVSPNMTLELAYSYVDMGDGVTGGFTAYNGFSTNSPITLKEITSHDLKLGVRWDLSSPPAYMPPLVTKG